MDFMTDNSLERNLIKELKDGSYLAFDKLFAKYGEHLFCFVFSILKSSDDSKEIVQDVFVKVWEKRQTLNEFLSFKSFLFSIAYHQIISGLRKKASEKSIWKNWCPSPAVWPSPPILKSILKCLLPALMRLLMICLRKEEGSLS